MGETRLQKHKHVCESQAVSRACWIRSPDDDEHHPGLFDGRLGGGEDGAADTCSAGGWMLEFSEFGFEH